MCANNTSLRKVARGSLNDAKQHFDSIECTVGHAYRVILVFVKGILYSLKTMSNATGRVQNILN
jgi:hypothetical protein